VVIDDLHVFRTGIGPTEADSVLIIDSNRMLSGPVPAKFLEVEARKGQRPKRDGRVQAVQSASRLFMQLGREHFPSCLCIFAVEDVLCPSIPKRDDQGFRTTSGLRAINA